MFIDRPQATFGVAAEFWQRVTGTTTSAARGEHGQFATLIPSTGDPHTRIQRVDAGAGGTHLDVHTDDKQGMVDTATSLGATLLDTEPVHILRSPDGYTWCLVSWHGEATPSAPYVGPSGAASRLDQLCLDNAPDDFEGEVRFWSELLGWPATRSTSRPEFASVTRPRHMPMRLLFQRLDRGEGPTTGHADVAAGQRIEEVVGDHLAEGAELENTDWPWTVLRDPSGHRYCVTPRDPSTGVAGGVAWGPGDTLEH